MLSSNLFGYIEGSLATVWVLASKGELSAAMTSAMPFRMESRKAEPRELFAASAALNNGIAGEHLASMAGGLGLGTCRVRAFDEERIRSMLGLVEGIVAIALMPIGCPDEAPLARRRKSTAEILF
jgi:nitroreductase